MFSGSRHPARVIFGAVTALCGLICKELSRQNKVRCCAITDIGPHLFP